MILGQSLAAGRDAAGNQTKTIVVTPWIASWGDAATFLAEVMAISPAGMARLTMDVFTKNTEDVDPSPTATSQIASASTTGTGNLEASATGIKELVRLRFTLEFVNPATAPCCMVYIHFRPLNPSWKTN